MIKSYLTCLLVIDFPDERLGARRAFDHMHAWFASEDEAHTLKRKLETIGGNHLIIDGPVCPFCGQTAEGGRSGRRTKETRSARP